MYSYIKGVITEIMPGYIVLDNNGIGYKINTPNPYMFKEGSEYKIYTYEHIREDEHSIYGFNSVEEKDLFLKLIDVKGLGPNRENILYLKKFPKIGEKVARQIVLDLKGKLVLSEDAIINDTNDDVVEALKALGYKGSDITKVIPKLNKEDSVESQIKEALKLLLR